MKRKTRKRGNNRASKTTPSRNRRSKLHAKKGPRVTRTGKKDKGKKGPRKSSPVRRKKVVAQNIRGLNTDPRVLRALGLMRRGISASVAAREEKMKLNTFRRRAGKYLHRAGPGKPWKARSQDQLAASMTVLTIRGPITVVVHSSRERKLFGQYNLALRMFRAGEDGAAAALKAFEGKTVGGQALITDAEMLINLEEAGQLDFDTLYASFGSAT
jgi:hypothetical protein